MNYRYCIIKLFKNLEKFESSNCTWPKRSQGIPSIMHHSLTPISITISFKLNKKNAQNLSSDREMYEWQTDF